MLYFCLCHGLSLLGLLGAELKHQEVVGLIEDRAREEEGLPLFAKLTFADSWLLLLRDWDAMLRVVCLCEADSIPGEPELADDPVAAAKCDRRDYALEGRLRAKDGDASSHSLALRSAELLTSV